MLMPGCRRNAEASSEPLLGTPAQKSEKTESRPGTLIEVGSAETTELEEGWTRLLGTPRQALPSCVNAGGLPKTSLPFFMAYWRRLCLAFCRRTLASPRGEEEICKKCTSKAQRRGDFSRAFFLWERLRLK
ncbi:hypothetical protein NDU88_002447 [Pleurodeles waltl]|uniref:Uncharacterized protein n=1 Tax=Pleurodeles waltl TaxID=8319 RepID=A0AAV7MPN9_PLEWA|nr:hypothetical protein NDU88_002447 [Pleurodeles waltl]